MTPEKAGNGDPYGRRALFHPPPPAAGDGEAPAAGAEGKRALFSGAARGAPARRTVTPPRLAVVVECRTCLARTPTGLAELAGRMLPSVWIPTRRWPRLDDLPELPARLVVPGAVVESAQELRLARMAWVVGAGASMRSHSSDPEPACQASIAVATKPPGRVIW